MPALVPQPLVLRHRVPEQHLPEPDEAHAIQIEINLHRCGNAS